MVTIQLTALWILAYVLGSIPFGLVLTRLFSSVDLRSRGSRNIGATNVLRTAGVTLGILTLSGDALKGVLPVALAAAAVGRSGPPAEMYVSAVVLAAFMGHLFPVFTKCRGGGKGVATAAGCFAVISPAAALVSILVFVLLVCATRRVSVGSLSGSMVLPIAVWKATGSAIFTGCAVVLAAMILWRHRENLQRLIDGTEPGM